MKIGDKPIHFTKTYVKVQNENYPKTTGLLQLLFQKQRAFRKNYSETQPLRKSKSYKYKDFIGPYFDKSINRNVSGSGLLPKYKIARKGMRMDYVYWDDPNELVDRLHHSLKNSKKQVTYIQMSSKRVYFDEKPVIHVMHVWSYASPAARHGEWEQIVRDRERFRMRIQRLSKIIDPVLVHKHNMYLRKSLN